MGMPASVTHVCGTVLGGSAAALGMQHQPASCRMHAKKWDPIIIFHFLQLIQLSSFFALFQIQTSNVLKAPRNAKNKCMK